MQENTDIHQGLPPPSLQAQRCYDTAELKALTQLTECNVVKRLLIPSERVFLKSDEETLSYAQCATLVNQIAHYLQQELNIKSGDRVLLRGFNGINFALAWLAVVRLGAIAVATMPLLRAKELKEITNKASPKLCLCDERLIDEWRNTQASINTQFLDELRELASTCPSEFHQPSTEFQDIALLAFTSGTTGKPKAVVHTHGDLLAACECWPRHVLKAKPDDLVCGTPPLAFTFGLGGLLLFPLWAGCAVYLPNRAMSPEAMSEALQRLRPSILYTSPTFYRQLLTHPDIHTESLRICVSAGEALPDSTRQAWKAATGIEMTDGIGATEMFHIFISAQGEEVKAGTIGKVVPGYQARVVGQDGQELPRGEIGRLAVIGPTACQYFQDERQANYVHKGWNYPGDAFSQDAEGYFTFHARADDMIITSGYNVGGPEVEDCLLLHPSVAECGVVGKPDQERGMIVKAFVVLKTGQSVSVADLQTHVKTNLAPYKYPREIEFVSSLPRTETGKLQRFALRSQAENPNKHTQLQPDGWAKAKGYANGVLATGKQLYVGGQIGWNAQQQFESDDFIAQTKQTLQNIKAVLATGGAGPEHMVRMTWYILDRGEYLARQKELGVVYREVMGRSFPAMSCVVVAGLIEARAKVEIEVTAVL